MRFLVVWLGLLLPTAQMPEGEGARSSLAHDSHVIFGRMAVEGEFAIVRVRMFKDDLTSALQAFSSVADFEMAVSERADSLFLSYFNERFLLRSAGRRLQAKILGSGEEQMRADGGMEDVWWDMMEYDAGNSIQSVSVNNSMFFEIFGDQRNILKVIHSESEREHSFYFASGDLEEQELNF